MLSCASFKRVMTFFTTFNKVKRVMIFHRFTLLDICAE
ncbi:hypothetical protein AC91_2458 [Escherichia coli 6-175-07_S4_C1]|nr:hypothetical protein AC61_0253 [Escherichia coli 4-203-08_S3_C3]KEM06918.1 hypothetical protein AD20_2438 [Escherichia coli 6-175-07_S4_C2]KEM08434.1 hypothetical protein AC91_2458 [Escherichia coli 6-175-07_S4_C1]KEM91696.1 hypothetical protein AC92_2461 [Escherichia coli 6-537-08_S4_C1]CDK69658.1 hypothetical protein [Klebsiella pneumoniae IS22]